MTKLDNITHLGSYKQGLLQDSRTESKRTEHCQHILHLLHRNAHFVVIVFLGWVVQSHKNRTRVW